MAVGIVGAGIQGCALALELASRGMEVHLFDRESQPLQRASLWNEGKIHLGYIFAKDKSLASARQMVLGARIFFDFFERHLAQVIPQSAYSDNFLYAVHRDSMLTSEEVEAHLRSVDEIIREVPGSYCGETRLRPVRRAETLRGLNPELAQAVFETPERSVNVHYLADLIARAVFSNPLITFVGGTSVESISRAGTGFKIQTSDGSSLGDYPQVANCSWESRLAIDSTLGYCECRRWMHRYKLALHLEGAQGGSDIRSTTLVLAPLGDIVNFGAGRFYLSWYPHCKIAESFDLVPAEPKLDHQQLQSIANNSLKALSKIIPALKEVAIDWEKSQVRGGHIFAWGGVDIHDRDSGLHNRFDIGVNSDDGYHSIDTGKYGMAARFALEAADRIGGLSAEKGCYVSPIK